MTHKFDPVATGEVQGDVSRKMGVNMLIALNEICAPMSGHVRVLIIGAGYGNDMPRIKLACKNAHSVSFVCVEPSATRIKQLEREAAHFRSGVKTICGTFRATYDEAALHGPYDVVVATMSAQHVFGRSWEPGNPFAEIFSERGVFIGSYFDHDTYFSCEPQCVTESCGNIAVARLMPDEDTDSPAILGVKRTQVFGTTFDDPYVTPELIYLFSSRNHMQTQLYRGKSIHLAFSKSFSSIPHHKQLINSALPSVTSVIISRPLQDYPVPCVCNDRLASVPSLLKGKMLKSTDIPHFRAGNYAVAVKRDGIGQILVIDGRGLSVDNVVLRPLSVQFARPIAIQVERDRDGPEHYWALDMLPESFTYPDMLFSFRYAFMAAVVNFLRAQKFPIDVNIHVPVRRPVDLAKWASSGPFQKHHEGMVLVPFAGIPYGGYSATRYLKRVPTVDLLDADKVIREYPVERKSAVVKCKFEQTALFATCPECRPDKTHLTDIAVISKTPLRDRPDKKQPNPEFIVQEILTAPSIYAAASELMLQCDIQFEAFDLKGLDVKKIFIPDVAAVPHDTWAKLYLFRSAVPEEYIERVAQWMRQRARAELDAHNREHTREDKEIHGFVDSAEFHAY